MTGNKANNPFYGQGGTDALLYATSKVPVRREYSSSRERTAGRLVLLCSQVDNEIQSSGDLKLVSVEFYGIFYGWYYLWGCNRGVMCLIS